jgi:hypothetical protein
MDDHSSAGTQNPVAFIEEYLRFGQMLQHHIAGNQIECAVFYRPGIAQVVMQYSINASMSSYRGGVRIDADYYVTSLY